MKLGRNMARTFLDYYKLSGFISTKPSSGGGVNAKSHRTSAKDTKSNHSQQRSASDSMSRGDDRYDRMMRESRVIYDKTQTDNPAIRMRDKDNYRRN